MFIRFLKMPFCFASPAIHASTKRQLSDLRLPAHLFIIFALLCNLATLITTYSIGISNGTVTSTEFTISQSFKGIAGRAISSVGMGLTAFAFEIIYVIKFLHMKSKKRSYSSHAAVGLFCGTCATVISLGVVAVPLDVNYTVHCVLAGLAFGFAFLSMCYLTITSTAKRCNARRIVWFRRTMLTVCAVSGGCFAYSYGSPNGQYIAGISELIMYACYFSFMMTTCWDVKPFMFTILLEDQNP